ncbi:MAG: hypothetical protein IJC39_04840, partial [Firmicutes bacterium]|nr:hypothetical protein [Bacillota bacterium]
DGGIERFSTLEIENGPLNRLRAMVNADTEAEKWDGPMQFLDAWIKNLQEWRDVLEKERNEDGTPRYEHFKPIDDQIASCERVSSLVNSLLGQIELR